MKNNLGLETWGKISLPKRIFLEVKDRFRVNKFVGNNLSEQGINCYIPKLNKFRFAIGMVGVVVFIAIPFVTPLLIFPLMWGIKK